MARGVFLPSGLDLSGIKRDAESFRRIAKEAGGKSADELTKAFRAEYNRQAVALKEALARGLIDRNQFQKASKDLAKDFNEGVLAALKQLRKEGKATDADLQKLQKTLRQAGVEGGRSFQAAKKESAGFLGTLTSLRTVLAGVVAFLGIRRGISAIRESIRDAEDLAKSYLQVQSAAKLFGVSERDLADLSARARTEFALSARDANELSIGVTKFAARAGDASRAQELLTRALDLGAAQGLTAAEVNLALDQALRGVDEGTDRLLQKNPSTIYKEFAQSAGKAAGNLTEVEQKQAIVNAVIAAGQKVQGSYSDVLDSNVGKLTKWRQLLQSSSEEIGSHAIPVVTRLTTLLAGPLSVAVTQISNLFDLFADPLDRIIARMERLGQASELALPLILQRRIEESKKALEDLQREFRSVAVAPRGGGLDPVGAEELASVAAAGEARRRDPRDLVRLSREFGAAQDALTKAITTGSEREVESAQIALDAAQKRLEIARQIAAEEKTIQDAQAGLGEAIRRANLAGELAQVEAQVSEIVQEGAQKALDAALDGSMRKLVARKAELEKELGRSPSSGGAPDPIDPDAARRAESALERLKQLAHEFRLEQEAAASLGVSTFQVPPDVLGRLKEIVRLEKEIADIRKLQAESGKPGLGADLLAARQEELKRAQASVETITTKLNEIERQAPPAIAKVAELGHSVATAMLTSVKPVSVTVQQLAARIKETETELTRASLAGDAERTESARRALREQREALRSAVSTLAEGLQDSTLPAENVKALIEELADELEKAGVDVRSLGSDFGGLVDAVETAFRGILSAADAMGVFDDRTRRAITGVLDLVSGVQQLQKAQSLTGTAAAIAKISGIGAIAGAAIGIGGAIFGGGEEERQRKQAYEANQREIEGLTQDLAHLADAVGPFTQAVDRATNALTGIADKAGIPGLQTREDVVKALEQATRARAGLIEAQAKAPKGARGGFDESIRVVDDQIEALTEALDAFGQSLEQLRQNTLEDLRLRELAVTATQDVIDAEKLRLAQEAELKDAMEAGLGDDVIARIKEVQDLERQAADARRASEQDRLQQDADIQKLESEGMTQTAAITRHLIDQERALADLRKQGADAATLAKQAEADLAANRRAADDLETSIRRRHAERTGDTGTLRQLDTLDLTSKAADEIAALQKLFEAGLIPKDKLEELTALIGDDLADAIAHLGDAAADAAAAAEKAAQAVRDDFTEELLRAQGKTQEADLLAAERNREERRARAEQAGILDEMSSVIDQLYELEAAKATGASTASTGDPSLRSTESDLVQSITSIRSTEALTLADLARSQLTELRRHTGLLSLIARTSPANPADYTPPSISAAQSSSVVNNRAGDVYNIAPQVTVNAPSGNATAIADVTSRRTAEAIDRMLAARKFQARRGTGNPSLR